MRIQRLLIAFVVVTASLTAGVGISVGADAPTTATHSSPQDSLVLQLDWLQDLIERIDRFLESVVDLLNTIRELFGGGGG